VGEQVSQTWNTKAAEGVEIEKAGERTEKQGQANAKQVEAIEVKAVMKALNDGMQRFSKKYFLYKLIFKRVDFFLL